MYRGFVSGVNSKLAVSTELILTGKKVGVEMLSSFSSFLADIIRRPGEVANDYEQYQAFIITVDM